MGATNETLEGQLVHDLEGLSGSFGDDGFCAEVYRALTNHTLSKDDEPHAYLVLSWNRAAECVNELRAHEDHEPLPLAGSGGEGIVSEIVFDELTAHGWHTRPIGHD
jgi:hypothetical protein